MRPLAAAELLDVWERGRHTPPWGQALLLLTAACPETGPRELARLSIGRRDGLLSTLREWTFGSRLACVADCPACGERLELTFGTDEIRDRMQDTPELVAIQAEGYHVVFRLLNTEDLTALSGHEDPEVARRRLLAECVLEISAAGANDAPERPPPLTAADLPTGLQEAIVQQMGEADPWADIRIGIACLVCGHTWDAPFDIVSYFWEEIDDWARRTLREIHVLAGAYGWSESEILNTSAWRRRFYLEMVQA